MTMSVAGLTLLTGPAGDDVGSIDRCPHELFEHRVREQPEAIAVLSGGVAHTYDAVNRRANRVAHRVAESGASTGALVAVLLERSVDMVATVLGVLKAGCAFAPIDARQPASWVREILTSSEIGWVVAQRSLREAVEGTSTVVLEPVDVGAPDDDPRHGVRRHDLAYVIHTSGSTGAPKGVMVEHLGLANYLDWLAAELSPGRPITSLLHSSLGFDFSFSSLFLPLVTGGTLHLADPHLTPNTLPDAIQDPRLGLVRITPSHVEVLASVMAGREGLSGPDALLVGGEILRAHHVSTLRRLFPGSAVYNHYGPSEGVIGRCAMRLDDGPTFRLGDHDTHDPMPIGRPIRRTTIYLDPSTAMTATGTAGHPDEVGELGELLIGGVGLARGYLGRPDLTEQRFPHLSDAPGRVYRTGDVARLDRHGNLVVLGRSDDQVKVRGHRVEPGDVAARIARLPGVATVAVLRADTSRVQLVAFVVPESAGAVDADRLRASLAEQVPDYLVPHRVVVVDELPLTRNGKLDQQALLSLTTKTGDAGQTITGGETAPSRLHVVQQIWRTVLGIDDVTPDDDFLALGGDSISALQIVSECARVGIGLTSADILGTTSLRESLDHAVPDSVTRPDASAVVPAPVSVALTPVQHWFTTLDLTERNLFNQGVVLTTPRDLDLGALETAYARLVERHQALRLRFADDGAGWRQVEAASTSAVLDRATWDSTADSDGWRRVVRVADEALDIASGPVVRAVVVTDTAGVERHRLALVAHHLVVDTVSWRTMVRDIVADYRALLARTPLPVEQPLGFLTWAQTLAAVATSDRVERQASYWARHVASGAASGALTEGLGAAGRYADARRHEVRLDRSETEAVRRFASTRGLRGDVPVLTAVVSALAAYDDSDQVALVLESHGRVDDWAERPLAGSVGWFTARYPQRFDLERSPTAPDLSQRLDETLAAVPDLGVGYGLLNADRPPEPGVSVNFLGDLHTPLAMSADGWHVDDWWHWQRDPAGVRPCPLEVTGAHVDGELVVRFVAPGGPPAGSPGGDPVASIVDAVRRSLLDLGRDSRRGVGTHAP